MTDPLVCLRPLTKLQHSWSVEVVLYLCGTVSLPLGLLMEVSSAFADALLFSGCSSAVVGRDALRPVRGVSRRRDCFTLAGALACHVRPSADCVVVEAKSLELVARWFLEAQTLFCWQSAHSTCAAQLQLGFFLQSCGLVRFFHSSLTVSFRSTSP